MWSGLDIEALSQPLQGSTSGLLFLISPAQSRQRATEGSLSGLMMIPATAGMKSAAAEWVLSRLTISHTHTAARRQSQQGKVGVCNVQWQHLLAT